MERAVDWTWKELPNRRGGSTELSDEEEEAQLRAALEDAFRRGRNEGMAEGKRQARQELAAAVGAANQAVDAIREEHDEWMTHLEGSLSALSVGIARYLIEKEIREDPGILQQLVERGLTRFPSDQTVKVHVNPTDLQLMRDSGADLSDPDRDVRWLGDPTLPPGSFLLEGPECVLDGRVDKALEKVYRSLADG